MLKPIELLLIGIATLIVSKSSTAQGFTPPAESNAVIYFVRLTHFDGMRSGLIFHGEEFISNIKGANYFRYECKAGEHLFWSSAMNNQFIECDVKAGGTYIVLLHLKPSFPRTNVFLEPITRDNPRFIRTINFVNENPQMATASGDFEKKKAKLEKKNFADKKLAKYHKKWKDTHLSHELKPEFAIPEKYLY